MKFEENMYFRSEYEGIGKILELRTNNSNSILDRVMDDKGHITFCSVITRVSHNIIDLIEVGDYVNGRYVEKILQLGIVLTGVGSIGNENIKSVLTKEQFEIESYKVED